MLTTTENRLLECLQNGMTAADAAAHVGVSAAFVSQTLKDKDFKNKLATARIEKLQAYTVRDDLWNKLEDKTLKRLEESVDGEFNSMKLLKIAQVANAAKRRGAELADELANINGETRHVVTILVPEILRSRFVRNAENEITEVNGRELKTVDASVFVSMANTAKEIAHVVSIPVNKDISNVELI